LAFGRAVSAAMDGRRAEHAGAIFGRRPWMARVPNMQKQFFSQRAAV